MLRRFEQFCTSAFSIYRSILKIERIEMEKFGLKGPHAQCLLNISRTVAELEVAGMLIRNCSGNNRYRAQLVLTDMGRQAAGRVAERAKFAVEQAGSGLSDEQRAVFYYALGLIADNLQSICDEGLNDKN